jgi:hypothetical protein
VHQRIEIQLEPQILDRLCQSRGCQFNRFFLCNSGRIAPVPNLPEALDVFCNGLPSLLPDLCQVGNPSFSSFQVVLVRPGATGLCTLRSPYRNRG